MQLREVTDVGCYDYFPYINESSSFGATLIESSLGRLGFIYVTAKF